MGVLSLKESLSWLSIIQIQPYLSGMHGDGPSLPIYMREYISTCHQVFAVLEEDVLARMRTPLFHSSQQFEYIHMDVMSLPIYSQSRICKGEIVYISCQAFP